MPISQEQLIQEYYVNNPNRDIGHEEAVDWLVREYQERTGEVFRDPDRVIRKLSQSGFLIKVSKGVHRYDPDFIRERQLEDFSADQKAEILKRDGSKCVICGKGKADGVELHIDHVKPKDLGGKAEILNGQTLCAQHNFLKKNLKQTETGKKMFIRLYELAKEKDDQNTIAFCKAILDVYEEYGINEHIEWQG